MFKIDINIKYILQKKSYNSSTYFSRSELFDCHVVKLLRLWKQWVELILQGKIFSNNLDKRLKRSFISVEAEIFLSQTWILRDSIWCITNHLHFIFMYQLKFSLLACIPSKVMYPKYYKQGLVFGRLVCKYCKSSNPQTRHMTYRSVCNVLFA